MYGIVIKRMIEETTAEYFLTKSFWFRISIMVFDCIITFTPPVAVGLKAEQFQFRNFSRGREGTWSKFGHRDTAHTKFKYSNDICS